MQATSTSDLPALVPFGDINRRLDPPVLQPVPPGYVAAEMRFQWGAKDFQQLFKLGGVVVRDRMPVACVDRGWPLRKVYVDPVLFERLQYVLVCAGIGELRRKGEPKRGNQGLIEVLMAQRLEQAQAAIRHRSPNASAVA